MDVSLLSTGQFRPVAILVQHLGIGEGVGIVDRPVVYHFPYRQLDDFAGLGAGDGIHLQYAGGHVAGRAVLADLFAAHRKLASMGNNLNQIARATNAGRELPIQLQEPLQHTMAAIRQAAARLDEVIDGMPKP